MVRPYVRYALLRRSPCDDRARLSEAVHASHESDKERNEKIRELLIHNHMPTITLSALSSGLICTFEGYEPIGDAQEVRVTHRTLERLQTGTLEEVNAILERLASRVLNLEEHSIDPSTVNVE